MKQNTGFCSALIVVFVFVFGVFEHANADNMNEELLRFARAYFYENPATYLDGASINSSNRAMLAKIEFEPSWFLQHDPEIVEYMPPGKWQEPYEYLNNKFAVSWRFIPGCEQRPDDKVSKPNWFNKQGHQCLGGYSVRVILNGDLKGQRIDIGSLD